MFHHHLFESLIFIKFTKVIDKKFGKGQTIRAIAFIRTVLTIMRSVTMFGCWDAVSIIAFEVARTTC